MNAAVESAALESAGTGLLVAVVAGSASRPTGQRLMAQALTPSACTVVDGARLTKMRT